MMRGTLAFWRRDFLIWSSYRLAVVWQLSGVVILTGFTFFIGTAMAQGDNQEGAAFLAFALSGIAFTDYFSHGISAVAQAISENQKAGTLEPMLLAPIGGLRFALSSALFKLTMALGRMAVYLLLGATLFGFWHQANPFTAFLVLIPATVAFLGIGVLAAAFVILVKQADPVLLAYAWITGLLGGVLFPVELLPRWLQGLSAVVPLTHALSGVRAALDGATPAQVVPQLVILSAMAAVLAPLGVLSFRWAIKRAKQEGSLAQY
jgi:ABC-2 type transport system permease protein